LSFGFALEPVTLLLLGFGAVMVREMGKTICYLLLTIYDCRPDVSLRST